MILGIPLSILLLVVLVIFYSIDFAFMSRYDRERQKGKGWAWDYTLMTMAAGLIILLQPWLWPGLGLWTKSAWGLAMQVLGLVAIVASYAIHIWSRLHLQKFYAERVEIQPDHQVIQSGPYAFVRHPLITSFFLFALGLVLLNPALTTLLSLVYAIWDFTHAARQEEKLLSQSLPGYAEYMRQVPRFIPSLYRGKRD